MVEVVNLQAKGYKSYVNYTKPNKTVYEAPVKLNPHVNELNKNNQSLFQVLNPLEEVKHEQLSPKENKKVNKWLKTLTLSASSFLIALPVSAQEKIAKVEPEVSTVLSELPSQADLMEIARWAIGYSTVAIVAGGVVWIVATRVLQFPAIKKYRDMALEIATNTIKGITEALLIPTLVAIIIGVTVLLFGGIGVFSLPL